METKFNFTSQICTSRFQSERLLALGLKKKTADMCSVIDLVSDNGKTIEEVDTIFAFTPDDWNFRESVTPRWSLHRLWCLLPNSITIEHWMYARKYAKILDLSMDSYQNVSYTEGIVEPYHDIHFYANDAYESICKAIEWLIKEGYFNKEYLEE